jgi:cellulose synthase/poly-beta-1,6-N-acetylglucosamine synthase-like glycosyltransferase
MNRKQGLDHTKDGISIITCTKRPNYIINLFNNYNRQKWRKKELIIIINKDSINEAKYKEIAKRYRNVFVYRMPEKTSLGRCLNYGINKSRYRFVAKFDDDDYYAPLYLTDMMRIFDRKNVEVIGKNAHYVWLSGHRRLILRFPKEENKFVSTLPGATLVMKKSVFKKVLFSNLTVGEDTKFCEDCKSKGIKIYSGGRFNFVAFRRKFSRDHTWKITERELIRSNIKIIPGVKNIKNIKKIIKK